MLNQQPNAMHNGYLHSGRNTNDHSGIISASSSRMFTNYEISDDLARHLERKYGGRLRAHNSAAKIQRAFRHHRLKELYKQQVLGHPGVSARRQTGMDGLPFASSALNGSNNNYNTAIDRSAHFRHLAKSQPSLKYQPVTSLRAQLQAERQANLNSSRSQAQAACSSNSSSPRINPLKNLSQQRPYMELMSPRLSQRRPANLSTFKAPISNPYLRQEQPLESADHQSDVTIVFNDQNGVLVCENGVQEFQSSGNNYYRSSSPAARDSSPSNHHHQNRSVWLPRLSALNNSIGEAAPDLNGLKINEAEVKSPSQVSIFHSNSLPRMGRVLHMNRKVESAAGSGSHQVSRLTSAQPAHQKQMREWTDQQRRRLYRISLNFFNKKPERGITLLVAWGFVEENPKAIARLFIERRGLSKNRIGEFLGTIKSPFHSAVLESFVNEIPMYDMEIDRALRQILTYFRLPGEAQKIDHIMQAFAKRYRACNPGRLPQHISVDTVYILAFAIIMLNTDLHSPSLKDSKRMKLEEFVKNIRGIEEGKQLDKQLLHGIYERVKEFEFRSGSDHVTQVMKVDQSIIGKDKPKLVEPHRRLICYCRLHQVIDPNKKQAMNVHQREIFLFNDLMLVAKVFNKKKSNTGQYTLRSWSTLIGLRIEEFQNAFYSFGLLISCPDGQDLVFNAKNNDDRYRFMSDVRESIAEATEMEQLRLEMELDKQSGRANDRPLQDNRFISTANRADTQRDSGLPDLDQSSPVLSVPPTNFSHQLNHSSTPNGCSSSSLSTTTTTAVTPSGTPIKRPQAGGITSNTTVINGTVVGAHTSGGAESSSSSASLGGNGGVPLPLGSNANGIRRLSFNSLDSGMVEESTDFSV